MAKAIELKPDDVIALSDDEAQALNRKITTDILSAEKLEDVFRSGTLDLEDLDGEPVQVLGMRFLESDEQYRDGGFGFYAVIETDRGPLTTGARSIVSKMFVVHKKFSDSLPLDVVFFKVGKKTRSGWDVWDVRLNG